MGRFAVRILLAIFTGVVFLLIQSVFWSRAVVAPMVVVTIVLAVIAYFRPHNGLLVLAALAPLGDVWGPLLGVRMRGSETLVLAFLGGALLRGWTLHQFRAVPLNPLPIAALLFGLIVAGSCIEQLWLLRPQGRELFDYVTYYYLTSLRGFGTIFNAMLFLEGLALLLYAVHYCRSQPGFGRRLVRMLIIGGVAAAVFNIWFFVHELIETGEPAARMVDFFLKQRWSAHIGDVNAAGSFFGMIVLIACGLALKDREHRAAWLVAGSLVGLAMWMTASRTAIGAVLLVGAVYAARVTVGHSMSRRQMAAMAVATTALVAIFASQYFLIRSSNATPSRAVYVRVMFLETTWRMLQAEPIFGVGIGQYARSSTQFSSPQLLKIYVRENAHNNFAQVAGELGVVGLAAFLAVLAICLWVPHPSRSTNPVVTPVLVGLAAFIVSWLGGHPLLVPEVAYPFWIALGIVPGAASDTISTPHG